MRKPNPSHYQALETLHNSPGAPPSDLRASHRRVFLAEGWIVSRQDLKTQPKGTVFYALTAKGLKALFAGRSMYPPKAEVDRAISFVKRRGMRPTKVGGKPIKAAPNLGPETREHIDQAFAQLVNGRTPPEANPELRHYTVTELRDLIAREDREFQRARSASSRRRSRDRRRVLTDELAIRPPLVIHGGLAEPHPPGLSRLEREQRDHVRDQEHDSRVDVNVRETVNQMSAYHLQRAIDAHRVRLDGQIVDDADRANTVARLGELEAELASPYRNPAFRPFPAPPATAPVNGVSIGGNSTELHILKALHQIGGPVPLSLFKVSSDKATPAIDKIVGAGFAALDHDATGAATITITHSGKLITLGMLAALHGPNSAAAAEFAGMTKYEPANWTSHGDELEGVVRASFYVALIELRRRRPKHGPQVLGWDAAIIHLEKEFARAK